MATARLVRNRLGEHGCKRTVTCCRSLTYRSIYPSVLTIPTSRRSEWRARSTLLPVMVAGHFAAQCKAGGAHLHHFFLLVDRPNQHLFPSLGTPGYEPLTFHTAESSKPEDWPMKMVTRSRLPRLTLWKMPPRETRNIPPRDRGYDQCKPCADKGHALGLAQ